MASGVGLKLALSERGSCLVGGNVTLYGVSFITKIAYISRATLGPERHWIPLHLETDSIVWVLKRLRGYVWGKEFRIFAGHKALEGMAKLGPAMHEFSGRVSSCATLLSENQVKIVA